MFLIAEKPPVELVEISRRSISLACQAEADLYASKIYDKADTSWQLLLKSWTNENSRLFFRRDFSEVTSLAHKIDSTSKLAIIVADSMKKSLSSVTGVKLVSTRSTLNQFTSRFGQLPIPKRIRNRASSGEMLLAEALSAYNRKEHQNAFKKCVLAEKQILQAESETTTLLKEYYKKLPEWRAWVASAISKSKSKRSSAIVVDKMAHTCKVYVNGSQRAEYVAELGSNWLGDKKRKGDRATPEGQYHITMKKGAKHSKYYKALLINYPNEVDRREFKASKQKGSVSQLGGLIEIHGHGGKGANWTEGCVALQNRDIDHLFNMVSVGTPVVIVGTLSEPPEYLQ